MFTKSFPFKFKKYWKSSNWFQGIFFLFLENRDKNTTETHLTKHNFSAKKYTLLQ